VVWAIWGRLGDGQGEAAVPEVGGGAAVFLVGGERCELVAARTAARRGAGGFSSGGAAPSGGAAELGVDGAAHVCGQVSVVEGHRWCSLSTSAPRAVAHAEHASPMMSIGPSAIEMGQNLSTWSRLFADGRVSFTPRPTAGGAQQTERLLEIEVEDHGLAGHWSALLRAAAAVAMGSRHLRADSQERKNSP
jgi:hypothetical protein